jgi:hypothetical protein
MHSQTDLSCVRTSTPAKGSSQSLRPFISVRTGRHLEEDVVLCSLTATKNEMTHSSEHDNGKALAISQIHQRLETRKQDLTSLI